MYKLVAADLDETLLDDTHHVPERVRTAIAKAREKGVHFVPATGRPFASVAPTLKEIGLFDCKGEYVISFNGGVITDNHDQVPLSSCSLTREVAEKLYAYGVEHNLCMHIYTLDNVYLYHYIPEERKYIEGRMNITEIFHPTLDFLYDAGEIVVKLLYMSFDMPYLNQIEREFAESGLTKGLDVCYSSNKYLEFNAPGINKGTGLLNLAKRLGIKPEETIAVGDNSNDISMIEAAGIGVAVANASDEAKAAANYVCKADNNAGAVGEAIEKFILTS